MDHIFGAIIVLAALLTVSTVSAWVEFLLSQRRSPLAGLIPPAILLVLTYASSIALLVLKKPFWTAFICFITVNIPLLLTLIIYLAIRRRSYLSKLEIYRRQNRKPAKGYTIDAKTKSRLSVFFDEKIAIPSDMQKEVLTRALSGSSADSISTLLRYKTEDIEALTVSFEKYCAEEDKKESGISYTLSEKQRELFIQLMITSSPRALGCGEELLWTKRSLRALISDTVNTNVSLESVDNFLWEAGLVIPSKITISERIHNSEFKKWTEDEFEKIRMRALEENKSIYFCYTVSVNKGKKGRKYSMLSAVSCEGKVTFGVYKGEGGHKDFLDKLSQENGDSLFVIADGDENFSRFASVKSAAEIVSTVPDND